MSLILDAGALVAVERGDRQVIALLKEELRQGRSPRTHGGVLGQVWRGGSGRQAPLARLLPGLNVSPLDSTLGKRAGILMGESGTDDVVDAALISIADDGDLVITSDPNDLAQLASTSDLHVDILGIGGEGIPVPSSAPG